jgi:hypothetical protein
MTASDRRHTEVWGAGPEMDEEATTRWELRSSPFVRLPYSCIQISMPGPMLEHSISPDRKKARREPSSRRVSRSTDLMRASRQLFAPRSCTASPALTRKSGLVSATVTTTQPRVGTVNAISAFERKPLQLRAYAAAVHSTGFQSRLRASGPATRKIRDRAAWLTRLSRGPLPDGRSAPSAREQPVLSGTGPSKAGFRPVQLHNVWRSPRHALTPTHGADDQDWAAVR